jgi:hypothetical protein
MSVYSGLLPWDSHESKAQLKHKWISVPQMTYGPLFDDFCLSLNPGLMINRDSAELLGDWNKKKTTCDFPKYNAIGHATPAQKSALERFCHSFDPRLPFHLMTDSSMLHKTVGNDWRLKYFVGNTNIPAQHLTLVAASILQGDYYDANLRKEIYWGTQTGGDRIIPIVIDTGASISITGEKTDFVDGIKDVGPDERIQGLNHSIQVMGIGKVRWKIKDQLGQVAIIQTTAYFIPESSSSTLQSPTLFYRGTGRQPTYGSLWCTSHHVR